MGELLCRRDDLVATGAKGVTLGHGSGARDIVIVRDCPSLRAYENRCPHLAMPLEIVPDRFLDETGAHLVCTTHGARFRIGDGYCVSGPCKGELLRAIEIVVTANEVRLAPAALENRA